MFLYNCQDKNRENCYAYQDKISFYRDKLTEIEQNEILGVNGTTTKKEVSKIQDSIYFFYNKLIACEPDNISVSKEFADFLFFNNRREESIRYRKKYLEEGTLSDYERDRILQTNFYVMITTDSIKYRREIQDYYEYCKNTVIDKSLLKTDNVEYETIVRNKIIAIYYFEGYNQAIRLLKENNYDYKLTDLWQIIEQNHAIDVYRRMYDFDKPSYYPMRDITKSANYQELYNSFLEYAKKKRK
ncbi:hypothetical protein PG279_07370 [Riemerella anatipestifer]|nr:hypothetical protein [Riemerella anatipestifer]